MLDQNSSIPLYEQLMNAIRADIDSGTIVEGARMPSEGELEKQFKVSRITVRRAINELCEEGMLVKKQGKGTFVVQNAKPIPLSHNQGFHDVFEKKGMKVESRIVEKKIIKVKKSYADDLKIDPDDDVLYLKRVMYAGGIARMVDVLYLPLKLYPNICDRLGEDFSLFRFLKSEYGVDTFRQYKVMKVKAADATLAELLNRKKGEPLYDMYKISYSADNVPLHLSISYICGDDASYVIAEPESRGQRYDGFTWKV